MAGAGIRLIDNEAYWLEKNGGRIKVGGVGDYLEDIQDIEPTIADVNKNDFVVLVTHNPDYVEEMGTDKVDLVLAGHNHGGQVTFFGLWAPILPSKYGQKYRTGIVEVDGAKVIVSNGVGTITPPVRFFARPQIIIVDLL
jgi:predicted MPP superfamily phosphohydrolase